MKNWNKKYKGYIRWYDQTSGEGMVKIPELKRDVFFHWTADTRLKQYTNFNVKYARRHKIVKYKHMDQVQCKIIFDSHWTQIHRITPYKWIKHEDLVSDILLRYFEDTSTNNPEWWGDHILNNIISLTEER